MKLDLVKMNWVKIQQFSNLNERISYHKFFTHNGTLYMLGEKIAGPVTSRVQACFINRYGG
jgi:hypothetical protein